MESLITSTKNPLVKEIRTLGDRRQRHATRRIVVEGVRMLEEVLDAGVPVNVLLYDPGIGKEDRVAHLLDRAKQARVRLVPALPHVIAACSRVKTPQGLVAVVEMPQAALSTLIENPDLLLLVADRLQDPGNLGTIIRIADAAAATGVIVTSDGVDPYNPKVVRATMGSIFHLPVARMPTHEAIAAARERGVRILVADQAGELHYADANYGPPVAIVLGNEGEGADARWIAGAAARVRIPLYGRAESLNVAVAAGLLLYEARRRSM